MNYSNKKSKLLVNSLIGVISTVFLLVLFKPAVSSVDAVSGASIALVGKVLTTYTTATINWTEKEKSGTMQFCFGSVAVTDSCTTKVPDRGSANVYKLTNLKPMTTYKFRFYATYKVTTHYSLSGTFITDSSYVPPPVFSYGLTGHTLTAKGDSLANVIVTAKSSTGSIVDIDTTGPEGNYLLSALPGTYTLSYSVKNYTPRTLTQKGTIVDKDILFPDVIFDTVIVTGAIPRHHTSMYSKENIPSYSVNGASMTHSQAPMIKLSKPIKE